MMTTKIKNVSQRNYGFCQRCVITLKNGKKYAGVAAPFSKKQAYEAAIFNAKREGEL